MPPHPGNSPGPFGRLFGPDGPGFRLFGPGPERHFEHGSGANSLEWVIFGLVLAILILLLGLVAMRLAGGPGRGRGRRRHGFEPDAREVVRHRYARGEMSREEYLQASQDLAESGSPRGFRRHEPAAPEPPPAAAPPAA
jgi:uncharacterized membrane protein